MSPRLRVTVGTSPETMVSITSLVNTGKAHKISSDLFEGEIAAYIKNFPDGDGVVRDSEYFSRDDRQGVTWSIQVRGRFLVPYTADDILFGNTFDRPLKLPWGIGAVFKFMNYVDPTLEHDLQSNTKPWALSPLISTMPHFMHKRVHTSNITESIDKDNFPPTQSIEDSTTELYKTLRGYSSGASSSSSGSHSSSSSSLISTTSSHSNASLESTKKSAVLKKAVKKVAHPRRKHFSHSSASRELHFENTASRRAYFSDAQNRQAVVFGPLDVITTDFCYGFIEFSPSLSLRLPGGLSFDLMRYWEGQPVRFVCCERRDAGNTGAQLRDDEDPWGRIFWCIAIETCDDDDDHDDGGFQQPDID